METRGYRPCVVAVFINHEKKLLVAKRAGMMAWQFPQGGIEDGETPHQALYREMEEEIACSQFDIVHTVSEPITYEFPQELHTEISRMYRGQIQHWFVCKFQDGAYPDLSRAKDKEFEDLQWLSPPEILDLVIYWKKDAYKKAFTHIAKIL